MTAAKRIVFTLGAAAAALLVLEGGARAVLALADRVAATRSVSPSRAADLNDYQIPDPRLPGSWRLRPGIRQTLEQAIAAKERTGRSLAAAYFRSRAAALGLSSDTEVLAINADGFRGPEIDRRHARPRILALGDSCTFGTFPDASTWPRALEAELARRGMPVEVINGGVEGYSPRHVLARIDDYLRLEPQVTAIYLGWNALYAERPRQAPEPAADPVAAIALWGRAAAAAGGDGSRLRAAEALARPRRPDREDPLLAALDTYRPAFLDDVERIGEALERRGSRIVLLTLPGLYDGSDPTPQALAMGHLPEFTGNPLVLARLTARANAGIRDLAARRGWLLVDLDRWSAAVFLPRHDWFFDAVHLHERGQAAIGREVAARLTEGFGQRLSRSSMISNLPRSQASSSAFLRSNAAP